MTWNNIVLHCTFNLPSNSTLSDQGNLWKVLYVKNINFTPPIILYCLIFLEFCIRSILRSLLWKIRSSKVSLGMLISQISLHYPERHTQMCRCQQWPHSWIWKPKACTLWKKGIYTPTCWNQLQCCQLWGQIEVHKKFTINNSYFDTNLRNILIIPLLLTLSLLVCVGKTAISVGPSMLHQDRNAIF